jgi:glycosyltransferase involved in cell wall biosynthesis
VEPLEFVETGCALRDRRSPLVAEEQNCELRSRLHVELAKVLREVPLERVEGAERLLERRPCGPLQQAETIFLFVGRFTAVKRLPLLLAAYKRAHKRFHSPAPLVLVGGHPGEWEGHHPQALIREVGNDQAFLAGWHDHEQLPFGPCSGAYSTLSDNRLIPAEMDQANGLPRIGSNRHRDRARAASRRPTAHSHALTRSRSVLFGDGTDGLSPTAAMRD